MKNKKQTSNKDQTQLQRLNDFLGTLQRNQLDGTTILLESIFPFNVDPELINHLRNSLVENQTVAEA